MRNGRGGRVDCRRTGYIEVEHLVFEGGRALAASPIPAPRFIIMASGGFILGGRCWIGVGVGEVGRVGVDDISGV